jgi:hypothetical protein
MFRWKTPLGADDAVKHSKHNQKTHGNRGGAVMAGARVKFGKAKVADNSASGGSDAAPAAGDAAIAESPWSTGRYVPSERAKAIVARIAAEERSEPDYYALEKEMMAQAKEYHDAYRDFEALSVRKNPPAKLKELNEAMNRINNAQNAAKRLQKEVYETPIRPHPELMIRKGTTGAVEHVYLLSQDTQAEADWGKAIDDGERALTGMLASSSPFGSNSIRIYAEKNGVNCFDTKSVYLAIGERSASVAAHEMAHYLEFRNPVIKQRVNDYFEQRTQGEKIREVSAVAEEMTMSAPGSLKDIYPAGLKGKRDEVPSPYDGRVYLDKNGNIEDTEYLATGIQRMLVDPVGLARSDPERFAFMIDLLHSADSYVNP